MNISGPDTGIIGERHRCYAEAMPITYRIEGRWDGWYSVSYGVLHHTYCSSILLLHSLFTLKSGSRFPNNERRTSKWQTIREMRGSRTYSIAADFMKEYLSFVFRVSGGKVDMYMGQVEITACAFRVYLYVYMRV